MAGGPIHSPRNLHEGFGIQRIACPYDKKTILASHEYVFEEMGDIANTQDPWYRAQIALLAHQVDALLEDSENWSRNRDTRTTRDMLE